MLLDILFIAIILSAAFKLKLVKPRNEFNGEFISRTSCNSYKGLFALIVILHHIAQRVSGGVLPPDFTRVGYLAVAVFLFLSGYGLEKQNLSKPDYDKAFLLKRVPAVFIPFMIMCFIYWVIYALTGDVRTVDTVWHNFIANGDPIVWFSWYVVCILYFYIAFYILMKLFKTSRAGIVIGGIVFCILYIFICRMLNFGLWWYSTAFAFVFGIAFSAYEENILKSVKRFYLVVLLLALTFFVCLAKYKWDIYYLAPCLTMEFLLVAVLSFLFIVSFFALTLKFKTENKLLDFSGKISFEIYMVQGAVMLALKNERLYIESDILWAALVLVGSFLSAFLLNKFFSFILKKYSYFVAKIYKK